MGVREYAAALQLSPYALRKWRDRLEQVEEEIDWRAHLRPSAGAVVSASARNAPPESSLTDPRKDIPSSPPRPNRRVFSDEQKLAIALETEQPGVSVSAVAQMHGIVTGLLFRWCSQFGLAPKKRAQLALVALPDSTAAVRLLQNLVQPPDGMATVELRDGRRVFAPIGSDSDAVRKHVESGNCA
jgi:transposase-like protein